MFVKVTVFLERFVEIVRLKQFSEFKDLCQWSRTEQESSVGYKRGKKMEESPSAAKDREAKRGICKASGRKSSSAVTRQDIQINP